MADNVFTYESAQDFLRRKTGSRFQQQLNDPGIDVPPPVPPENISSYRSRFQRENMEPGVPIDFETGGSTGERAKAAFQPTLEEKILQLQDKYGADSVRLARDGESIMVRQLKDGKPVDVLFDEDKITGRDLMEFATDTAPEIVGSIVGMRTGQTLFSKGAAKTVGEMSKTERVLGAIRNILSGAVGSQTAAGTVDAITRVLSGNDIDPGEIASRRTKEGAVEVALGSALALPFSTLGATVRRVANPLGAQRKLVNKEAVEAAKRLEAQTGIEFPFTVGQETGSPAFARIESFMKNVDPGNNALKRRVANQEDVLRQLQAFMLGDNLPSDHGIGRRVLQALRTEAGLARIKEEGLRSALLRENGEAVIKALDNATLPGRTLYTETVGETIRSGAEAQRAAFRNRSKQLYDEVRNAPGGQEPIFDTAKLKDRVRKIRESLPPEESISEEPIGLFDEFGREMTRESVESAPSKAYVPAEAKRFLFGHEDLAEKMTLSQMVQMRRSVNDMINRGDAVPGMDTKILSELSNTLTQSIDEGVSSLPSGELKNKLLLANDYYKKNAPRFKEKGIAELFRQSDEAGFVGNAKIVNRVLEGTGDADLLLQYKKFFGPDSNEFKLMKRSLADRIVEPNIVGNDIDVAGISKAIKSLNPTVRREVFGKEVSDFVALASERQGFLSKRGDTIPIAELERLFSGKSQKKVIGLIKAQREADKLYRNNLIKGAKDGSLNPDKIDPNDFVSKFLGKETSTKDFQVVVDLLGKNEALLERVRRKAIQNVFLESHRNPSAEDLVRNIRGDQTQMVSGHSMFKALGDEKKKEKLKRLLGEDSYETLLDYIRVESARGETEKLGGMAGGIAQGMVIHDLFKSPLKSVSAIIKYRIASALIANPKLRTWMSNGIAPGVQTIDFSKAAVLSAPVLEALSDEFGNENTLTRALSMVRDAVGANDDARGPVPPEYENRFENPGDALRFLRERADQLQNSTSQ